MAIPLSRRKVFQRLVADQLVGEVTSFSVIDQIIQKLPTTKERGDAFEIFAEAMLACDPVRQVKNTYRMENLPEELLNRLKLERPDDSGIDCVIETVTGDLLTVQMKYRTDEHDGITYRDIATFQDQSKHAAGKILITTSNRTSYEKRLRKDDCVEKITRRDLWKLSKRQLADIMACLRTGEAPRPTRLIERDDQMISVAKLVAGLKTHGKGIFDAACGSGKTLVSERVIEQFYAETGGIVMCLAPSLNLIRQTLRRHARELAGRGVPVSYAVVCSDASVVSRKNDDDTFEISRGDVGIPVTTDAATLATFLRRPGQPGELKVIFSTYQSTLVVEQALQETGQSIDLTVFDEAHKTVVMRSGNGGDRDFSRALFDENIPSRLRLFMTATVKVRKLAKGRIDDHGKRFMDMNRVDLYGPIIHRFSHSHAISKGVIRAPKLIICTVDPEQLPADLRNIDVELGGQPMTGEAAAEFMALQQAIAKTGAKSVISFHTKTSNAARFAKYAACVLPGFKIGHVHCEQRVSERERIVDYLTAGSALVTNVRCLTEGIDVPEIDMIALFGNFDSRIDIAQMIGRALRKPPLCVRPYGYVLVPLRVAAIDKNLTTEEILDKTGLQTIRQVICALMDMDENFAELVQELRAARGHGDKRAISSISKRLSETIEVIGMEDGALAEAMTVTILEEMAENFWFHLGELQAFVDKHGHPNLKPGHQSAMKGKSLHTWLENTKTSIRKKTIAPDRREALEALGVTTRGYDERFAEGLALLKTFKEEHGHVDISRGEACNVLRNFVKNCRRNPGKISDASRMALTDLGFQLEHEKDKWFREALEKLTAHFAIHGHADIRRNDGYPDLYQFSKQLRTKRKNGAVSAAQIASLDAIGFAWDARKDDEAAKFDRMLGYLTELFKTTGNASVPRRYVTADGHKLGVQLEGWRQRLRANEVADRHRRQLAKIGIVEAIKLELIAKKTDRLAKRTKQQSSRREDSFEDFIGRLKRYIAQGGSPNVPQNGPASQFEGVNLGNRQNFWLKKWRKPGVLPAEYEQQLAALGVSKYRDLAKVRKRPKSRKKVASAKAA